MSDASQVDDRNITPEELQLAARNHGMPLEGLRYDVTPAGMHYLLIHFDVPESRPDAWRLAVDGHVRSPLDLGLRDLQARATVTRRVTLEELRARHVQSKARRVDERHVVVDQEVMQSDRRDRPPECLERHPVVPRGEAQLVLGDPRIRRQRHAVRR